MLTPSRVIQKKRDGIELSPKEIQFFIHGLIDGTVSDDQAAAFLMAVYFRKMSLQETVELTRAMATSGEIYDLSSIPGPKIDKHSTGGVGDKVSLILAPLAAACGLRVPMMSGRGLGHTGGTLDKLESIPGFRVKVGRSEFEKTLSKVGCTIVGQTEKIAPADKKLYAIRDVTATVECIPLIVASILSKKIAAGTRGLVLDIKVGSGAFMKNARDARKLARALKEVATRLKLRTSATLSNMNQPLGYTVGNSLEVVEAIEVLRGERFLDLDPDNPTPSDDLKDLTIHLAGLMLLMGNRFRDLKKAKEFALTRLESGRAWDVFRKMVQEQRGSLESVETPGLLPISQNIQSWNAKKSGYISSIDTENVGRIITEMGGGRKQSSDEIDPSVGLVFRKRVGAKVKKGEPIAYAFLPYQVPNERFEAFFHTSLVITPKPTKTERLVLDPNVK